MLAFLLFMTDSQNMFPGILEHQHAGKDEGRSVDLFLIWSVILNTFLQMVEF